MKGTIGGLVIAYILIGVAIVMIQRFTGRTAIRRGRLRW